MPRHRYASRDWKENEMIDLNEIKSRINPAYQDLFGTNSHERKMLCDEIEQLRNEITSVEARIAEACAKVCNKRRRTVSNGNGLSMWSHDPASVEAGYCADAISNGDWRKCL